jgi:hypothetical protein
MSKGLSLLSLILLLRGRNMEKFFKEIIEMDEQTIKRDL